MTSLIILAPIKEGSRRNTISNPDPKVILVVLDAKCILRRTNTCEERAHISKGKRTLHKTKNSTENTYFPKTKEEISEVSFKQELSPRQERLYQSNLKVEVVQESKDIYLLLSFKLNILAPGYINPLSL